MSSLDRGMAFAASLALYNWGLRVGEAATTKSDRVQMTAGKEWEDCLDQHTMTAVDVMIGRGGVELGGGVDSPGRSGVEVRLPVG